VRRALLLLAIPALALAQQPQATSLRQRVDAAVRQYDRGERDAAMREFDRFIDVYNAGPERLSSEDLVAVAIACTYLGTRDPQLFHDARRAYDRAIEKDPRNLDARVRLAKLFLDKYNSADAKRTLDETLAIAPGHVPALVLEARRRSFDHQSGADSLLALALRMEPENVAARVLRARFHADVEEFDRARAEVARALRADPGDRDALAFGFALELATGDSTYVSFGRRFAAEYPADAGAHVAAAELLARVRQYASAADWAAQGVIADSLDWRAHGNLGLNLLRLGQIDSGRASLERAFKGDPFNVWVKNTLDLLDTFSGYHEIRHGRFRFMIDTAESAVLSPYLEELADRAHATMTARYQFTPQPPIRMEVYRSHADFSVRTVGLAGLGALGVSFGTTVAFDSPAAKDVGGGHFNWGSTAWHELAHTFTLGASAHRVPRWLSEGLSVYEERRARKGWGQGVSPAFLRAYKSGSLRPASRLNDGFVRPAYPQQVIFSYYQASLVCEMIARDFGEGALVGMLRAYRDGLGTEQVVRRVLRIELAELDRRFDAYLRQRFDRAIAALGDAAIQVERESPQAIALLAQSQPGNWDVQMAAGRALLRRGDTTGAAARLERARALVPEFGGADGPYPWLVRLHMARGDRAAAMRLLQAMFEQGEVPADIHTLYADLLLAAGDTARAADALDASMYVEPFEIARHEKLATLYTRLKAHAGAVRERRVVVALKPVDRAEALYQLALAYRDAGDAANARRSVLRALEEAPHFEQAQQLLLALRRGT